MEKKLYGLIGRRLGHSWSVPIHCMLGCQDYQLIELEPEELRDFLQNEQLCAINVTIPYKRDVMPYCDVIDAAAAAIGSVNTIVRKADGKLYAYNTDMAGFCYMAAHAGIDMCGKKVVVLGSGGASLMAQAAARQQHARQVVVISRSGADNYENLSKHADAEIIVNATPVGMYPHTEQAPVDLTQFPACEGVLDLIYNPRRTALLMQAELLGLRWSDGLPMLVAQAVEAERHFFGRPIPDEKIEEILSVLRAEKTNIVLIGMPGCGKSSVGAALAARTGREAIDIDSRIEERIGCSIPAYFASHEEADFRQLEHEEIASVGKLSGKIILTGGGAIKDPRNYPVLHQNGRIYHLLRPLTLLPTDGRPLSQANDPAALWAQRKPLYESFCDTAIENNNTIEETACAVWEDFCEHSCDERPKPESAGHTPAGNIRT